MSIYDFSATDIRGTEHSLSQYKGKVLLIVNTASKCGFTHQLKGLESMYEELNNKGLEILGFPCNQFAHQDKGTNAEIDSFCRKNYGVSFQMFAKVDVNGNEEHPLFKYLKSEARGVFRTKKIKWNFTKFLVNQDGKVLRRYASASKPEDIQQDVKALLNS